MATIGSKRAWDLLWVASLAAWFCTGCSTNTSGPTPPPPPPTLPMTGPAVPELAGMDLAIGRLMEAWRIPGGAVAITYRSRLVYARGFGYADTVAKQLVQPTALFRIASLTKPITAVAMMTLVQAGKVALASAAFPLIGDLAPPPGQTADLRTDSITVAQLLYHTAGWSAPIQGDPLFQSQLVADALGIPGPPTARQAISYMLGKPLVFRPGVRYDYFNLGFVVAGRVIEKASGQSYEQYIKAMLATTGIHRVEVAHTRLALRNPDEVHYYDRSTGPSVFPDEGQVSLADGALYYESADAAGGLIASVVDLARFLTAVDGSAVRPDLLTPATLATMLAPPPRVWDGSPYHYGLGWLVRPTFGNWWHDGSTPGTTAFMGRFGDDLTIAAVFNARDMIPNSLFGVLLEDALAEGITVTAWPSSDLFPQFP